MAKDKVLSKYAHQRRFKVGDRVGFSFLGDTRYGVVEDMKRKDQYYIYYVRCNSTLYNLGEEGITSHGHVIDFEDKVKHQIQEEYDQRLLAEPIVEHDISASLLQHDSDAPRRSQVRTRQSNKEPSPEKKVVRTRKTR